MSQESLSTAGVTGVTARRVALGSLESKTQLGRIKVRSKTGFNLFSLASIDLGVKPFFLAPNHWHASLVMENRTRSAPKLAASEVHGCTLQVVEILPDNSSSA